MIINVLDFLSATVASEKAVTKEGEIEYVVLSKKQYNKDTGVEEEPLIRNVTKAELDYLINDLDSRITSLQEQKLMLTNILKLFVEG